MKAVYTITITFLAENDEVKQETYTKCIFDYINDGRYFFVQEEDEKENDHLKNKLHWYPAGRIIKIDAGLDRTFETKREQLDYYKIKSGTAPKGAKI